MIYDAVVITNLPAFYKINLYQAISATKRIFVIFVGNHSHIRTHDFSADEIPFPHAFLSETAYEARSTFQTLWSLIKILRTLRYKKIMLGGWDLNEYWLAWMMHPKRKLLLALESGIGESKASGITGLIKRVFLMRIGGVLASGPPHLSLLKALRYRGKSWITDGVGLVNPTKVLPKSVGFRNRYLYLGRLSPEKNLETLIQAFNQQTAATLTIVGNGPDLERLKSLAGPMIYFQAHIPNTELDVVFQEHDALILPSLREPWGLVVEEALYHGLPVLLSNTVGCRELVECYHCGYIFDPNSKTNILKQMKALETHFEALQQNVLKIDFKEREEHQINQFQRAFS